MTFRYIKLLKLISLILLLFLLQNCESLSSGSQKDKSSSHFDYTAPNSLYSVSFSGTPTIKETMFPINGNRLISETAELILPADFSFQRTESAFIEQALSKSYNKESIYEFLTQYAEASGLSNPEIQYYEIPPEKVGAIKGYKKISLENKGDYGATYYAKVYIRDTCLFIASVGCMSDKYPTDKIIKFLNSIRLKN